MSISNSLVPVGMASRNMKAVNQSIGWLVSSRPYRWRKLMFGPPRTLGLISVTYCCLVGVRFLDFLAFFFSGVIGDSLTNAYCIFSVVPINEPRTKVSFIAYFGFIEPSNSVGGRRLGSSFSGSGMGSSLGVRSSHRAVTSNPDIDSWRRTDSPPPPTLPAHSG